MENNYIQISAESCSKKEDSGILFKKIEVMEKGETIGQGKKGEIIKIKTKTDDTFLLKTIQMN